MIQKMSHAVIKQSTASVYESVECSCWQMWLLSVNINIKGRLEKDFSYTVQPRSLWRDDAISDSPR